MSYKPRTKVKGFVVGRVLDRGFNPILPYISGTRRGAILSFEINTSVKWADARKQYSTREVIIEVLDPSLTQREVREKLRNKP